MVQEEKDRPLDLGFDPAPERPAAVTPTDLVAIALSLVWLVVAGAIALGLGGAPDDRPGPLLTVLALVMPVALIWVVASATRAARMMREDATRLRTALDALRQNTIRPPQDTSGTAQADLQRRLDDLARAQARTERLLSGLAGTRETVPSPPKAPRPPPPAVRQPARAAVEAPAAQQPSLALGIPAGSPQPLTASELIRALHFPETLEDREGFRAMRRALADRQAARLMRSAQDVLTLLGEDDIYMDDLRPDGTNPETWRRFAKGERGTGIAALGAIDDQDCLDRVGTRMKQDPVFRDVTHHFLRHFDRVLTEFAQDASDEELGELVDTRTGRSFRLLGQVTGMFGLGPAPDGRPTGKD